jgi:hypothetical protein
MTLCFLEEENNFSPPMLLDWKNNLSPPCYWGKNKINLSPGSNLSPVRLNYSCNCGEAPQILLVQRWPRMGNLSTRRDPINVWRNRSYP